VLLAKVASFTRATVGGDHLVKNVVSLVSLIIIRDYTLGKLVKQEVEVHDISLGQKVAKAYVVVLFQKVDIAKFCSSSLP
jgi:hypothetical protein